MTEGSGTLVIESPSGAICQACTEVGMEAGDEQQHSLLRRKQRLLPEALLTRKLQGQDLTAQPEVPLRPPSINNSTAIFMLHKSQAILCKVSMLFLFSVCSHCHSQFQKLFVTVFPPNLYPECSQACIPLCSPNLGALADLLSISRGWLMGFHSTPGVRFQHLSTWAWGPWHSWMSGKLDEDTGPWHC